MNYFKNILVLIFLTCLLPDFFSEDYNVAYSQKLRSGVIENTVAFDMNADGSSEIIYTDFDGRIYVLNGKDGTILWEDQIQKAILSSPIVGKFINNTNFQILMVISVDGNANLIVYDGITGEKKINLPLENPESHTPTTCPPIPRSAMEEHDGFAWIDGDRNLHIYQINSVSSKLSSFFSVKISGRAKLPPVISMKKNGEGFNILVSNTSGETFIYSPDPRQKVIKHGLFKGRKAKVLPFIADFANDGQSQLVVCDDQGMIHVNDINFESGSLNLRWNLIEKPVVCQPLVTQISPTENALIVATENKIKVLNPKNGEVIHEDSDKYVDCSSAFGVYRYSDNITQFLIADTRGNIFDYAVDKGILKLDSSFHVAGSWNKPLLVSNFINPGSTEFLLTDSQDNQAVCVNSISNSVKKTIDWLTVEGNFYRNGQVDQFWLNRYQSQRISLSAKIRGHLTSARTAFESGDYKTAKSEALLVLKLNPLNQEARELTTQSGLKKNFIVLLIGGIVAAIVVLVGSILIIRQIGRKRLVVLGRDAEEKGNYQKAIEYYTKATRFFPNDLELVTRRGKLHYQLNDFTHETLEIFKRCLELAPNQKYYMLAVSNCYIAIEENSSEALEIIQKSIEFTDEKAPYEYYLAKSNLEKNDPESARKFIDKAIKHGEDSIEAWRFAAKLCIDYKQYDETAEKYLAHMWEERQFDPEYLDARCEIILALRRFDENAAHICKVALDIEPDMDSALLLKANLALVNGEIGEARECAKLLLEKEPENIQALWIQSHCIISEEISTPEALETCLKTLEHFPEDNTLNRHCGRLLWATKPDDPETEQIVRRALELNPNDTVLIEAVVELNQKQNNYDDAIYLLENLINSGSTQTAHHLKLAKCYLETANRDSKTERSYWIAHREYPDDRSYLDALGDVLIEQEKLDSKSLAVYTSLIKWREEDHKLKRVYAKALHQNKNFSEAAEISSQLLTLYPDDVELKKLHAEASLYNQNLDSAIDELRGILRNNPDDHQTVINLGIALGSEKYER